MITFQDLKFQTGRLGGVFTRIKFDNGYGASIVQNEHSYGGKIGLYEIAVLDSNGNIVYNTPITDDVLGYLSEEEVTDALKQISELENADKKEIADKARAMEHEREIAKKSSPWIGYASTAYQLAIVVLSASILAVSMAMFWASFGVAGIGLVLSLNGLFLFW